MSQNLPTYPFPLNMNLLTQNNVPIINKSVVYLYDQNSFRSFNLIISPQNLSLMILKPTDEKKVGCSLISDYNTLQARTINPAQCAFKGSVGSLRICFDEYGNPINNCRRLSLSVTQKNKTDFLKYIFNGMAKDYSLISERTAFHLMNSLGMYSPLSTHAKLFLNGQYLGLYSFVEPIDETFTALRFGNDQRQGTGGLYKDMWLTPNRIGTIKDNRKAGNKEDDEFLQGVINGVINNTDPKTFLQTHFDMPSFINLTAFNTLIGSTDDWRQRHNFYLYVRLTKAGNKVIVFLPWDYDRIYDDNRINTDSSSPWWVIRNVNCNIPVLTSQERAVRSARNPAQIPWYKDIYDNLPFDIDLSIKCDRFTQILAQYYGNEVRQRTREFISRINLSALRNTWNTWNDQIRNALIYDVRGPNLNVLQREQNKLYNSISRSINKALNDIGQN